MAYTFLDNSLNTIGVLTNKGGQTNDYWGDSITHEIATSQDVLTSVSLSIDKPSVNIDTSGNQKTWNHVIQGLSFNIDGIGRQVNENDYLIYQEGTNGKYYLMAITQVDESAVQSGFHYKTVQGLNAAAYDLSRKTLRAKSFAQIPDNTQEKGTAQNILKYIFEDINWDVRTIGSFGAVDYDIAEGTTAQAVLLDIIGMFEAEVDAYVQLNNWGKGANVFNKNGSIKRIFDFSTSLGKYRGETVRYNKNMVSITKTGARDSMYTKLYVNGNNITIADANKGADFIVDDVANRKYNKLGSVSTPVTYLEGIISNSAIESPTALLAWGKKQLKILNHPRYNYQISATNDDRVQLGDTVIIQDTHASDPIYLKSKVISKTVSLADPANNSFIVGEFSPIVIGADNGLEDTNQIMQLVNQANQTAIKAQNKANENAKKIVDTRTNLEKTIDQKLKEGQDYSDSLDQKQKEAYNKFEVEINKGLKDAQKERDEISEKADDMLTTANKYSDDIYTKAVTNAKAQADSALSSANSALSEAKSDLTTAIGKETEDRNKAVSAVNSQAQDYATQAKADALNTITKEVTDRKNAVSALDTKATNAVNQAKSDINDTINAISVGGRNLLLDTGRSFTGIGNNSTNQNLDAKGTEYYLAGGKKVSDLYNQYGPSGYLTLSFDWVASGSTISGQFNSNWNEKPWRGLGNSTDNYIKPSNTNKSGHFEATVSLNYTGYSTGTATGIIFRQDNLQGNITISNVKLETGNKATDWTLAPEDVVLDYTTKDNKIKETITQYQTTNDGNVTKAQTDATTALGLVATKVSQTDYDTKTGDLSSKYTQVKQTVDSQATDIVNIKKTATSQASKINSISSDVDGTKQSISDIETTQDSQSNKINQITSDVNGTKQSITDIQTKDGKQDTRMGTIETSVSGVKSDFSTYKTDANGRISTAQTTAQTAVDGLSTKVSQTDYNKKTGDLSTAVNTATQTATETKNELAKVSKAVGSESAKINTISNTVDGTTQTISDIKTEQGKQSGSIATLQSRADGFDATVTKVDNLSVGGRNLIKNGDIMYSWVGEHNVTTNDGALIYTQAPFAPAMYQIEVMAIDDSVIGADFGWQWDGKLQGDTIKLTTDWQKASALLEFNRAIGLGVRGGLGLIELRFVKAEKGNIATDWTPAPEDLSSATAKAQLTADNATLTINNYKTDADGRIHKAQSDITATANEVKTKVSQSDYNTKTGDLSTKVNTAQSTANSAVTTIGDYKTSNDKRVKAAESAISQNAKDITARVSQTDYDKKTGELSGSISTLQQRANGFDATVTKVNNLSVGGTNLVSGTNQEYQMGYGIPKTTWQDGYAYLKLPTNVINGEILPQSPHTFFYIMVQGTTYTQTIWLETDATVKDLSVAQITWYTRAGHDNQPAIIQKLGQNSYKVVSTYTWPGKTDNNVRLFDIEHLDWAFNLNTGTYLKFGKLKLEKGNLPTDWSPAPEDVESRVTALKLDIDGIHGTVNDPNKGLSATWNLASNGQTTAITAVGNAKKAQDTADTANATANSANKTANDNLKKINTVTETADGTQQTVKIMQGDFTELQSQQTITAGQVTTEIEDRKNGDTNTLTQAKNFTSSSITSSEKGMRSEIQQSADGIVAQIQNNNLVPNSEFEPKNKGWRKFTNSIGATPGDIVTLNGTSSFIDWPQKGNSNGITYNDAQWLVSEPSAVNGSVVSASIVAGRVSTIGNIAQALDMRIAYFDKDKKLIGSNSFGNIIDGSTYKGLQLYKLENMTPTSGTRYIGLVIAHSGPANDCIFRPMLNYGKTVSVYQPTYSTTSASTVLALFKDNWSIGINDNSGKLISGINGDTSGTVIQGKKLVINPDTTFNGLNFMNGALIKDASISQAKIGNLQVNSAQITGLDVSKLTGDTANFVTANIKSLNANKLYGDTGYLGTVSAGRVINNQDHHLQLAAHGLYNDKTHRAQFELLSYDDPSIDDDMKGSLNYYSTTGDNVRGIRFKANQILAIDTYPDGAGSLYLSAYERGQVIISARDSRTNYKPIKASKFNVSSERRLKSDITDLDDGALEIVNKTKIHQYTKNETSEIGVIADEAPEELLSDDDKSISLYDYTSVLYKAVQELSQKVKELQDERTTTLQ